MKPLLLAFGLVLGGCSESATLAVVPAEDRQGDDDVLPTEEAGETDADVPADTGTAPAEDAADSGQPREESRTYAGTVNAIVRVEDEEQVWEIPCTGSFLLDVTEDGVASGAADCQNDTWQVDSVGIFQGTVDRGQANLSWTLSVWGQTLDVAVTGQATNNLDGDLALQEGDWTVAGNMLGLIQ